MCDVARFADPIADHYRFEKADLVLSTIETHDYDYIFRPRLPVMQNDCLSAGTLTYMISMNYVEIRIDRETADAEEHSAPIRAAPTREFEARRT